jgi:D-alanyl-lipoteichoic acid acyltransferase DltB (MBOAT superfamily)
MLFNSFTYLLFLPIVVAIYWLLPVAFRRPLLLVASYFFYMSWKPVYGLLIATLTVVNFFLGLSIARFESKRKFILISGLIFNLGCLCYFKYATFLLDSLWNSATWLHSELHLPLALADNEPVLNIILPLGISFFTFEFIHYITDVYKGSKPVTNFLNFALFASFFPSQIAGPIKRFQDFVQQLQVEPVFSATKFQDGVFLIFQGLFKKVVLSDNLAQVVNPAFAAPTQLGTVDAWMAATGFVFQIFLDFSGYTDIGRGSALLLGYKVPENFNWPFVAASLADMWRRWHMSLSSWLRDYLFIPLGGSRVSAWKFRRNMFITMTLAGLWHGAAWHFVLWGAIQGVVLALVKDWQVFVDARPSLARLRPHILWHLSGVFITQWIFVTAAIFFRAESIPQALAMESRMFTIAPGGEITASFLQSTLPVTLSLYVFFLLSRQYHEQIMTFGGKLFNAPHMPTNIGQWWQSSIGAQFACYVSLAIIILGFAPAHVAPFIYFQF